MSSSSPAPPRPGSGRTVEPGHGSSAELKTADEQSIGGWAVVDYPNAHA